MLQTIYVTHGHGDHFFGLGPLVARHPGVQVVALPEVVDCMREQTSPAVYDNLWEPREHVGKPVGADIG